MNLFRPLLTFSDTMNPAEDIRALSKKKKKTDEVLANRECVVL